MVRTSTLKKSAAAMASQCAFRNVFHGKVFPRNGAGSIPLSFRIRAIVERPKSRPSSSVRREAACTPTRDFREPWSAAARPGPRASGDGLPRVGHDCRRTWPRPSRGTSARSSRASLISLSRTAPALSVRLRAMEMSSTTKSRCTVSNADDTCGRRKRSGRRSSRRLSRAGRWAPPRPEAPRRRS
jgi:hypothetical protein